MVVVPEILFFFLELWRFILMFWGKVLPPSSGWLNVFQEDAEITGGKERHLHRKVEGNFGQSELLIGDRACIERVLGRPHFIPYSTRCAGQWMCCKIYSCGCWYYGAVVLWEEDKSVLFWENACCHLSCRKWIRGFHNLFMERPPLWFIFLGAVSSVLLPL